MGQTLLKMVRNIVKNIFKKPEIVSTWFINVPTDKIDISKAREDLDHDHHAMEDVKKRILEYLAVRQLKNSLRGPILCFVGPPGVGKTSIGKSIANTLGRKFHRYV